MLEDLRSQINSLKVNQDNEMNRMESRLMTKMDENLRNSERYVSSKEILKTFYKIRYFIYRQIKGSLGSKT